MNYDVAQIQQRSNEDRYQIGKLGSLWYFAIFDGHGGPHQMNEYHVADYCVNNLHNYLGREFSKHGVNNDSIVKAFVQLDTEMYHRKLLFGCTCTCVIIDHIHQLLYQINLGDSKSIVYDDQHIISATIDHNTDDEIERDRITKADGTVIGGRVMGLAVSRSFGDFELKSNKDIIYDPIHGMISSVPEIKTIRFEAGNRVLICSDAPYQKNIDFIPVYTDESLIATTMQLELGHISSVVRNIAPYVNLDSLARESISEQLAQVLRLGKRKPTRVINDDITIIHIRLTESPLDSDL